MFHRFIPPVKGINTLLLMASLGTTDSYKLFKATDSLYLVHLVCFFAQFGGINGLHLNPKYTYNLFTNDKSGKRSLPQLLYCKYRIK